MSSAKVTSGAPVGHTTSAFKLNGVRAASVTSSTPSVTAVNISANAGSATDQYLSGEDDTRYYTPEPDEQENAASVPYSTLNGETSTEAQLQFQEHGYSLLSLQEVEKRIEMYERTIEQSDDPIKKKTQGFG